MSINYLTNGIVPSSANMLVRELKSQVQGRNFQNHDHRSKTEN